MYKNRNIFLPVIVGMLLMLFTSCHSSRKVIGVEEGWDLLGTMKVNFVRDRDELRINNNTRYTGIRFRVEDHDVHISDLKVYFSNGDKLEPAIDDNINANQESRFIQLDAEGRMIDHIEFKYHTLGNMLKGRATVMVYGRRYDYDRHI
jgi:hypothetical protein